MTDLQKARKIFHFMKWNPAKVNFSDFLMQKDWDLLMEVYDKISNWRWKICLCTENGESLHPEIGRLRHEMDTRHENTIPIIDSLYAVSIIDSHSKQEYQYERTNEQTINELLFNAFSFYIGLFSELPF